MKGQPTLITLAEQLLSSHFWTVDWFRRPYFLRWLLGMWQMQLMRFECEKLCKKSFVSVFLSPFLTSHFVRWGSFCTSDLKLHLFFFSSTEPSVSVLASGVQRILGTPWPLVTIILNRRLVWKNYNLKPHHMLTQHWDTWVTTTPQNFLLTASAFLPCAQFYRTKSVPL